MSSFEVRGDHIGAKREGEQGAALAWRKSSYSDGGGGDCVEVSPCACPTPTTLHIRDSKNPTGPTLTLSSTAWAAFVASA
ncbi:DUF397 domain-containing protein [Streptomyces sp. BBFR102]|uniref:DUF397 domain-containing protein n=1 Tax=Streptomyces sp. BBFR102 TaxID=3448171 RepID=UPI003F5331DC